MNTSAKMNIKQLSFKSFMLLEKITEPINQAVINAVMR